MATNVFRVLDSDMHIMEPPDLWQRYIEPEFKDQAPIGLTSEDVRDLRMAHSDGRQWGHNPSRDKVQSVRGQNFQRTQTIYRYYSEQGWSAKVQLEAMDVEGIDVAVLYPTRGLTALAEPHMEPRLAAAIALEVLGVRIDREGRCLLLVEGTQTHVVAAPGLERHVGLGGDQFARFAVEHENMPLLGHLRNSVDRLAVALDSDQSGRHR